MRVVVTLITVLFAANVVCAQTPTMAQAPDLQVVKYSWTKDRIDWEKNPHGRRTEISEIRSRRGSILEEREAREQKRLQEKPTEPPRYVFDYKLTVVNAGSKAIKEIEWDYAFTDAATGEELGRRVYQRGKDRRRQTQRTFGHDLLATDSENQRLHARQE